MPQGAPEPRTSAPASTAASLGSLRPEEIGALVSLLQQGRLKEVEDRTLTLLNRHAGTGIVWKLLSVALVRQGKNALVALRRTVELMPGDAEAHNNLGSALLADGQPAEALTHLRRALALGAADAATLAETADALRAMGRSGESLPLYEQALKQEPRAPETLNNLGNALLALGRPADAAARYRAALGLRPQDASIHSNLADALRQQGQLPEALAESERAIALDPRLAMAHNNRGLCLAGLGQREAALASYRQALALRPDYVEAISNLGALLRDLGELREALPLHVRAAELDPRRPENHCELGMTLFELRRLPETVDSFRRALALRPAYPQARVGLATALRALGRADEAEAACRAVLAVEPGHVEALALLGELQADRGRFPEARELFERVITLDPEHGSAYASIAAHGRMTREDTQWLKGAQALLGRPRPLRQQISLRYALGKYFDDVGEHDEAFRHYQDANELAKRQAPAYDREGLVQLRERISAVFDAGQLRQEWPGASFTERPVFVIGMPRSGTSLAEQILASHPQVFGAGEIRFWNQAFARLDKDGFEPGKVAQALPQITRDYLDRLGTQAGDALRVVDKMPANFLHAGLIHAALPHARFIHMQRHPLDTCLSVYFQNFFNMGPYAHDLGDLAHFHGEYQRIMAHWRAVLPAGTLLEVPYEGLVEDPEGWSRRMVEFAGLPWDPKVLEFHQTPRVVLTASKWQVRQKIHSGSIGRWRNYEKHLDALRPLLSEV